MTPEMVSEIINQALKTVMILSAPMMIGALVIGILVSIFQAVTQINEQTLSFVPKILVIIGAMVIFAPWMMETMTTYTKELIINIPNMVSHE